MRWWSILWPVRFWYGYAGDATPDNNSLKGIGNSKYASTPGSLKPYYSAALTVAEARRKGLTPAVGPNGVEHASGEEFQYNGKTYRWDDTFNGDSSFVDIYAPDRGPDKGVSNEQINHDLKIMNEHGIGGDQGAANRPSPPPFKGVTYEGPSKPPAGAVDQGHEQGPQAEEPQPDVITSSAMPTAQEPVAEPPENAVKQSPVSQDEINQIKAEGGDPEAAELGDEVINAHSAAVAQDPNDQRVTRRINPDTGSNKIVGSYFVPGDPVHEQMLANLDPVHRAKLPVISQAIQRGGPFSFLYGSAQQEGGPEQWQGERPTGESRQYEQAVSTPEQRLAGETQQQSQRVSLLPMQMMMSQANNPLLEGFVNDAVMNNGAHLLAGAQQAKVPVPYNSMQDPNLHKDVMGFLENQAHGYMGDGTPMVDENGQPHPLFVHNQASATPYIPRLLQRPAAEFVHGMLNIRQPKNPKPATKPPGFGERAAWQRRVNQGYAGQKAGFNSLLHKLDTHLPQVGMRNKKGNITRHVPWSEGTLEPTWRAYRPELMSQLGAPPIGTQSMRDVGAPEQIVHRVPHFRQTLAQYEPHQGAPIAENPEVGAPVGTPNAPAQPGLLAGGDVGAEAEPEEFGSVPGGAGGMDFASPSVREGMTMNMAKYALRNPQKTGHEGFKDFNNRLEQGAAQASGAPAPEVRDAIGSWADGAENSLRTIYGKQDRKTRRLVNAIRGLHSAQKQVLNFHYDDEGPHSLTSLAFHHDNPQAVADLLDKHGLQYRTLEAPGKGERVWAHIVDTDGSLYPKLEKLIKGGHVADSYYRSGHADFIGDPNGEDREEAAREYARVFQEARSEADQGWKGRGKPSGAPRPQEWWEPFAQEAQLNYDKLKQGDELKKQQLAKDLKAADADRQNITPERAQELEQIRSTAQAWVDKNPKLHNLAVHHYLPGGTESLPEKINPKTGKPIAPDNEDIATHFEARNPRLDYSKDADRKKAALAMTHDIMRNLAANPKSYGWYDATVDKAMDKIAEVAPEIKTDPAHAMALRLAMAVTSQGQKVVPNFESAYKIYRYWKENGRFPVMDAEQWKDQFGGGTKRDAMIKNFDKLNDLWYGNEAEGKPAHTLEELKKILETEVTVGDLKREHDLSVSGEAVDHKLPGAAFMGPKIGIFYSNLNKIFHHTTMDLWFSRTLNRMAGNMFKFSPAALTKGGVEGGDEEDEEPDEKSQQSQLDRLEAVMKSSGLSGVSKEDHATISAEMDKLRKAKDLTRLGAMKLAPTLTKYVDERHRFYQKSEGLEGSYNKALGTEENRAAKNIDLNFHGLADAPRTSTERKQWRLVMDEVDKNLKGAGLNVNAADKQALLWYLEQGLFQGPNAKSSMDYLDAAHILARKVKNGEV